MKGYAKDLFSISATAFLLLFSGCVEDMGDSETENVTESITTIQTTTETTLEETTTTNVVETTTTTLEENETSEDKKEFTCADYCRSEGYDDGICRKTAAECRRYGASQWYMPLGNKYCPKATPYDACCCILEKVYTTTAVTETTTTTIEEIKPKAENFEKVRPIETTIEYSKNGLLTFKILNAAGVDIEITNVSSGNCSGVGIGSLESRFVENGREIDTNSWCDELASGDEFGIDLAITYKELVSDVVEIHGTEEGYLSGLVL